MGERTRGEETRTNAIERKRCGPSNQRHRRRGREIVELLQREGGERGRRASFGREIERFLKENPLNAVEHEVVHDEISIENHPNTSLNRENGFTETSF